jgi:hypothetical protein
MRQVRRRHAVRLFRTWDWRRPASAYVGNVRRLSLWTANQLLEGSFDISSLTRTAALVAAVGKEQYNDPAHDPFSWAMTMMTKPQRCSFAKKSLLSVAFGLLPYDFNDNVHTIGIGAVSRIKYKPLNTFTAVLRL